MKTSTLIKIIGILCIVIGAFGIMESTLGLLMQGKESYPEALKSSPIVLYMKVFVKMILSIAGIFFLLKKPFALILIYIALIISILNATIPFISLIKEGDAFVWYLFQLISPAFYTALLIIVYRIRKYYFKSQVELEELHKGGQKSKAINFKLLKILSFLGILFVSVPFSILVLWIYSSKQGAEAVSIFNSYFPMFLQGQYDTAYLSLAFCILVGVLSIICLKLPGKPWKILNILVLVLSGILLCVWLWSLM